MTEGREMGGGMKCGGRRQRLTLASKKLIGTLRWMSGEKNESLRKRQANKFVCSNQIDTYTLSE